MHAAADRGLTQITHLFNAQSPLHHRRPGVPGAGLADDRIIVQVIADGLHLHPDVLRIAALCKGAKGMALISDSMEAAGMPDGQYDLGGQAVFVKNGEARLADGDPQHDHAGENAAGNRDSDGDEHPGGFRRREGLRPHRAGRLRRADADGRGLESRRRDCVKTGGTESLQVAIYATEEKRRRTGFDHVLVLARRGEALILRRDRINACWVLPEGQLERGQSAEEAARSALGEAVGEAVFDVYPLCAYGVTEENGKESGGFCYVADVREWPDEAADEARAFDRLPLSSQMDRPALILALHKWAGEWFDARITLERLGQPAPF